MPQFTPGELEIMHILWEHGPKKPGELQELFPRPIKNCAVRAALRVLVEKGHITRRKHGKAFFYNATTPRQSAMTTMLGRMKEVFCGGSPTVLIAHLMETEDLTEEEIRELQLIAHRKLDGLEG